MSDPYEERYTSKEMQELHSDKVKYGTWRRLWVSVAKVQKEMGLADKATGKPIITDEMISELEANVSNLNVERAKEIEKKTKHDVMAHIKAFKEQCPTAGGILHLALTSRAITDNQELYMIRESMNLVRKKLVNAIDYMAKSATEYSGIMTLAFTHFQPAQATVVGRRLAMHGEELLLALDDLEYRIDNLPLRGVAGTVGTHTDMLSLFDGDYEKVKKLEEKFAKDLGFNKVLQCTGQTYHRMIDYQVGSTLFNIGIAARRFATTIRLLQGLEEMEEPFAETQVGSTAMPWKRNPKNAERMSGLVYCLDSAVNALGQVAANQWLEGSVEDSSPRRIKIREEFYAVDGILDLYIDIARGVKVYNEMISAHVRDKLPLIATNTFMMEAVKKGGDSQQLHGVDRQQLHEFFREHAHASTTQYRAGGKNDFLERIANDQRINLTKDEIESMLKNPALFVGDAIEQTNDFVNAAAKRTQPYKSMLGYVPNVEV